MVGGGSTFWFTALLPPAEAVTNAPYDLILMDCFMPEMDGYAAATEIRRREALTPASARPHIPIIALTASVTESDRQRCLAAGMDDFLSKPCRSEDLRQALARWIEAPVA
ncbi:MAG: response regulator [Chloroflexota bacterium]